MSRHASACNEIQINGDSAKVDVAMFSMRSKEYSIAAQASDPIARSINPQNSR
jgi:hypothetical protein